MAVFKQFSKVKLEPMVAVSDVRCDAAERGEGDW